jgi:hypothetical protein
MVPQEKNRLQPWLIGPLTATLCIGLLVILTGSAVFAFPEGNTAALDPSAQLLELNKAVHFHTRYAEQSSQLHPAIQAPSTTLRRAAGTAEDQVLLLMAVAQKVLGLEPRLAVVRLSPSGEQRVVMDWNDRYYDPCSATVYDRNDLSGIVRVLSYPAALSRANRYY